jgi:membrane fusion protein (multidrug efflux system)
LALLCPATSAKGDFLRVPVAIAATLLLVSCGEGAQAPGGGPPGRGGGFSRGPTIVVTELAQQRAIRDQVEAIGTARANESVTITAKVTDTVNHIRFEDSGFVEAGDVLVELTNEEQTALLAEAEANVDDARTQFNRLEDLLGQGSVPISQVDEARAKYSAAQARYQSIVARLDDRLITAPFAGVLGFRQVSAGTLITPGTAITTLDDVSIIKLDFSIPEVYLNLVQRGTQIEALSPAYPDEIFNATLRTVGSRVDPITRAATVRAHINNDRLLLRPGMLLTAKLTTAERETLMVPESALVQRSAEVFVYTIEDGRASMREVTHGIRNQGWVEILSGLSEGEEVITEGVIKIRNGAPVSRAARLSSRGPRLNTSGDD